MVTVLESGTRDTKAAGSGSEQTATGRAARPEVPPAVVRSVSVRSRKEQTGAAQSMNNTPQRSSSRPSAAAGVRLYGNPTHTLDAAHGETSVDRPTPPRPARQPAIPIMNGPQAVFGAHLVGAALVMAFGLFVGLNGSSIQIVIFGAIAAMLVVMGRYASSLAARR